MTRWRQSWYPTARASLPFAKGAFAAFRCRAFTRSPIPTGDRKTQHSTAIRVHGLTRQGRDFDVLAAALAAQGHRVLCPDLPGRGESQWLRHTMDYVFPQYCADMNALMSGLSGRISWVGTSLGGLIGIVLAGQEGSPIARLALNDIGPDVSFAAAGRISLRCARMPSSFATFDEAESGYRKAFLDLRPDD